MTKEESFKVIYGRLSETLDILIGNLKSYKGDEIKSICGFKYAITVYKVVKSIINDIQNENKRGRELIELLYLSKFILHGFNEARYYIPCKLEGEDYSLIKENFERCVDMIDILIKSYEKYD